MARSAGVLAALIFLMQFSMPLCSGQELKGIPSSVKTPQDLGKWLSGNFQYQMKLPEEKQTPQETIEQKAGDCDDFARLVSETLAGFGIPSEIVEIKTKGVKIMHAICIWKDESGSYNFFSNRQLFLTREKSMEDVLSKYFPLSESASPLPSGGPRLAVLRADF